MYTQYLLNLNKGIRRGWGRKKKAKKKIIAVLRKPQISEKQTTLFLKKKNL